MRIAVDWTRCDGHGLCALAAPRLLALDEWGFPLPLAPVRPADERTARRALAVCPALALRLERDAEVRR
jgi:ferredoxin